MVEPEEEKPPALRAREAGLCLEHGASKKTRCLLQPAIPTLSFPRQPSVRPGQTKPFQQGTRFLRRCKSCTISTKGAVPESTTQSLKLVAPTNPQSKAQRQ